MDNIISIFTLKELLASQMQGLKTTEMQVKAGIASWVKKETSAPLKAALHDYLDITEAHIVKLDAFCAAELSVTFPTSDLIITAWINSTTQILSACAPTVRDVFLIATIQQFNHYKISAYGTAAAFAAALGLFQAGFDLHQAGQDEKAMDEHLSYLAEHQINKDAIIRAGIES